MDYTVYVLYSFSSGKTYTGYSSCFISRFHFHNEYSPKGYTSKFRPWYCIHVEFYADKKSAMLREKELKSGKGREWIKNTVLPLYT